MPVSKDDVEYVAKLARIELAEEEKHVLTSLINSFIDQIEKHN